jgi:hypothetical protein
MNGFVPTLRLYTCMAWTVRTLPSISVVTYSSRSHWPRVLRPLTCWDRGFEFHPGAWMSVCFECCALTGRLSDHSFRGVLPTVVRHHVWYRNLRNEGPKIIQFWLNLRDLLAGGDLITQVSLPVRFPASQPAHQLIKYLVLWLLIKIGKEKPYRKVGGTQVIDPVF